MIWLILSVLAIAGVVALKFRRPRGLRLPPPNIPVLNESRKLEPWEIAEIQEEQRRQAKQMAKMSAGKRMFVRKPGHAWNPMKKYPRNAKCTCGSGRKFKACCLNSLPEVVPVDRVDRLKRLVELAEKGEVNVPLELAKAQAKLRDHAALQDSAAAK